MSAEELLAWLRRILVRNAEDLGRHHRRLRRHGTHRDVSLSELPEAVVPHLRVTSESPASHLVNEETAEQIRRAMHTLPAPYERVDLLRARLVEWHEGET